jgi:major intrinsic protein
MPTRFLGYEFQSGAQVNPAVTIGLLVSGKLTPKEAGLYIVSQFIGAIIASAVVFAIFGQSMAAGVTLPSDGNVIRVLMLETVISFEQLFFDLFLKVRQEIDEAIVLYYSSTPPKKEIKLRYRKAIRLLNELLDIFYEMMNVYTNYSPIRWSKAIQNKDKLEKLFSAVFSKIAKMRIRLSDAIASFRSHDFTSLADQYIPRNIYASEKLINQISTFSDSYVGKDSEPLLDCLWKIYDPSYEYAFPEPSLYQWDFKYSEGYKKFIEIQNEHPDQTYSNFIKSYSKD